MFKALALSALLFLGTLNAQTIAEKKAGLVNVGGEFDPQIQQELKQVNHELKEKQQQLRALYNEVLPLYESHAPESRYRSLVERIRVLRLEIAAIEHRWSETVSDVEKGEGYALWDQSGTTLEQLVIDYGSQSYVYVVPPDIGAIPLSVTSSLPIPRALWSEMLELILEQHGIGVQQLNPYLRMLYHLKDNRSGIKLITSDRKELEFLPKEVRIAFVISPDPADARRVGAFLERFINPVTTSFAMVGRDLVLVTSVAEIQELLKLYDFVAKSRGELEYKLVPLHKVDTKEMGDILQGIFEQIAREQQVQVKESDKGSQAPSTFKASSSTEFNGLRVIPLTQVARAIFLLGTRDEIAKAEEIIREVEEQVGTARGKVVFTYRVKHADPEPLAELLNKIYQVFVRENIAIIAEEQALHGEQINRNDNRNEQRINESPNQTVTTAAPTQTIWPGFYQEGQYNVNPTPVTVSPPVEKPVNVGRDNFIVDPKTNIIVMVVEPDILPRLKDVLRRLDVRRKMVQLDVLLYEKTSSNTLNWGLNLLRIGDGASNVNYTSLTYNDNARNPCTGDCVGPGTGILDFIVKRVTSHGIPAYDIAYRFLLQKQDGVINANPSVITLNGTPANIVITTETSISTGTSPIQTSAGLTGIESFTRAQYGTTITITPTIHSRDPEDLDWDSDMPDYVFLDTEIHFDDFTPSQNSRPDILRRQIKNQVTIVDGQTVIMGGLKRKQATDSREFIPYLGEIPCIGKLFGTDNLADASSETFIFITPTIIKDPCEDIEKVRLEQFARRPGDVPDFLCCLDRARRCEQERLFAYGMSRILHGFPLERCIPWGDDACRHRGEESYSRPYGY